MLDFVTRVPTQFPTGRFSRRDQLRRGPLAAGTPGNLAGWCELVHAHGSRKLSQVFAPAIALARDGHLALDFPGGAIHHAVTDLAGLPFYEDWQRTYLAHSSGEPGPAMLLRQPDLARTLEILAAEGPEHFYRGALARQVVAHLQSLGGCLTAEDFAAVHPAWLDPVSAQYRGLELNVPPPPSEAFQMLLTLRILEGFHIAGMARNGVEHLDTVWRAIRLAAGARIEFNKPGPEKLAGLLADQAVATFRARLAAPGPLEGPAEQSLPETPDPAREHTTSFSVADRAGNLVCLTQSLGGPFGCGVVVPGTGICLNNFLYWGEVTPGATNPLIPGTDLALPLAPTIATRAGRPVLALGTPGSYGICQTQAQALVQHLDFALPLQAAIETPRARLWDGSRVTAEGRLPAATLEALRERGHDGRGPGGLEHHGRRHAGHRHRPGDRRGHRRRRPPPRGLRRGSLREKNAWTANARPSPRATAWWRRRTRWPPPPARASSAAGEMPSTPPSPPPPRWAWSSPSCPASPASAWPPAGSPATSASAPSASAPLSRSPTPRDASTGARTSTLGQRRSPRPATWRVGTTCSAPMARKPCRTCWPRPSGSPATDFRLPNSTPPASTPPPPRWPGSPATRTGVPTTPRAAAPCRWEQVLRQADLAATFEAIAARGIKHLYGGELGRRLVEHVASLGGFLGLADLEAVSPEWGRPVSAAYRDLVVHVPRPPSQAFQYLLTLRILDGFDIAAMARDGVEHLDTVWRAIRLAAMTPIAHDHPDPDQLDRLLSEEEVEKLRRRAADGRPVEGPVEQWTAPAAEQHTTSLSVADRAGNLVCITQSLGSPFGCGVVVPGTGVCLNNALYWGEHDPRATNALRPGRVLTSPMAPSVATRAGRPVLALGTPGSYGICQTQAQALVQHVDFGAPLAGRHRGPAGAPVGRDAGGRREPHRPGGAGGAAGPRA